MVVKIEEDALASVRKAHFVAAAIGNSRRGSVFEHANFLRVHAALKRCRRRTRKPLRLGARNGRDYCVSLAVDKLNRRPRNSWTGIRLLSTEIFVLQLD